MENKADVARLRRTYKSMRQRCYNPTHISFPHYGGRGIKICSEWLTDREAFVTWALANGYSCGLSIDRVDNDEGYAPGNCRWVTQKEQLRNQRRSNRITFRGQTLAEAEWCERLGVSKGVVAARLRTGHSLEVALTTPRLIREKWVHGTRTGYEYHGCRCAPCVSANRAEALARYHRKRRENEIGK